MNKTVVIEQGPNGFRYRVIKHGVLVGSSVYYTGFDEVLYALKKRFPTYGEVKVETS